MLGTTEACGVEGFVQLLSGSSRRRAHGGDGEHFGEQHAQLGQPMVGNRGGERGGYGEAQRHNIASSHLR
jgi:hypothetical protein